MEAMKIKITRHTDQPRLDHDLVEELAPKWLPAGTFTDLWIREEGKCLCCGAKFDRVNRPTPHHLLPRSAGGSQGADNLVLLCYHCHDRLEDATDTGLQVLGKPYTMWQLVGIFEKGHDAQSTETSEVKRISEAVKQTHASRILKHSHNTKRLCQLALRHNWWSHVDWNHVAKKVGVAR